MSECRDLDKKSEFNLHVRKSVKGSEQSTYSDLQF